MTVEDPIEYLHSHGRCLVNQREVGTDTNGLDVALRQDPDIILVGELCFSLLLGTGVIIFIVPVFGPLFTKLTISRWSRTTGTLLHVGVPVLQALDVVGGTTGNAVIGRAMEDVKEEVRAGGQMSPRCSGARCSRRWSPR